MKPNPDWKVLNIFKNDKRVGLKPPAELYKKHVITASKSHGFFRSPWETLFWAYLDNQQEHEIYALCDHIQAMVANHAKELPTSDLVAAWAIMSNVTARAEVDRRAQYARYKGTPTNSLDFGLAMLLFNWNFWITLDTFWQNAYRGLGKYAKDKQDASKGKYKQFLPVDGIESIYGSAFAEYGFAVAIRTEGDPFWKAFFKERSAYMCAMFQQPAIVDWEAGVIESFTANGDFYGSPERRWDVWEGSRGLFGAAIGPAHPITPCYTIAKNVWEVQSRLKDQQGNLLLSDQKIHIYGSYYEGYNTFGIPTN